MNHLRTHLSSMRSTFWWFGIAAGAAMSLAITMIVVVWEWLENPGGIFHDENGTNWSFVAETAVSWFVPTFIHVAVIASIAHLLWWAIRRRRKG